MIKKSERSKEWEADRIEVLRTYEILDTPPDQRMDLLTKMAADLLQVPIAFISLVDTDRIWYKSKVGFDIQETKRRDGLCGSVILTDDLYQEGVATTDKQTLPDPGGIGEMGIRFYAAVPLLSREGYNLGAFGVMDRKPRQLKEVEEKILKNFSQLVIHHMELRLEARQAVKHQYEVLSITAHDLKNPLAIMPLLAEMLLQNKDNPKAIEDIATQIRSAGKRMNKTINELLESARENTGTIQLRSTAIDLSLLVQGVVASNRNLAEKKQQRISLQVPDKCVIFGDHRRLTEVVDHLINNAIKFSPLGTHIQVLLDADPNSVVFQVKDEGPGLEPEDFKNLFKKFNLLSARATGGERSSGLGLSNVKLFVEAHRGKVSAENNTTGPGANFRVHLPISNY